MGKEFVVTTLGGVSLVCFLSVEVALGTGKFAGRESFN